METLLLVFIFTLPFLSLGICFFFGNKFKNSRGWLASVFMAGLIFWFLLTVVFAGGESYYRWIADSTDSYGLNRITARWFDRHYKNNSIGLRDDRDYSTTFQPNKLRITFLGDSFTAGHGVKNPDERFANLLREANPLFDIHIFAMNGWGTKREISFLKKSLKKGYQLGEVILVYVPNDIADILPEWNEIMDRIYAGTENESFWVKNSYLINTLYYRLRATYEPEAKKYFPFVIEAYAGPVWETQKKRLRNLKEVVESAGGRFSVVTFPFLSSTRDDKGYLDIHKQLGDFWESLSVPHLDLYPVYEKYKTQELVVNRYDAHPNAFAHRLAAEAIADFLKTHLKAKPPRHPERSEGSQARTTSLDSSFPPENSE